MTQSITYGYMPIREDFSTAFARECPNGYRITLGASDSRACDGFKLGDGTYSEPQLWDAVGEIVNAEPDDDGDYAGIVGCGPNEWYAAMDLVSSIMETLGFEWI